MGGVNVFLGLCTTEVIVLEFRKTVAGSIKLMKGKALRKHSLHSSLGFIEAVHQ